MLKKILPIIIILSAIILLIFVPFCLGKIVCFIFNIFFNDILFKSTNNFYCWSYGLFFILGLGALLVIIYGIISGLVFIYKIILDAIEDIEIKEPRIIKNLKYNIENKFYSIKENISYKKKKKQKQKKQNGHLRTPILWEKIAL